ncbi:hypothetical protein BLNAU_12698 [Blattamonas nauphoetae]|uniref:Transmembrane protein n=1 Tax=Blattamonas nauphoetae TaxID=2049346 RepID=A0ABQ9XLE1_9EUKA|nr:hypothetical protein BLNAU_12698 [Blattamonas nauphoetae]
MPEYNPFDGINQQTSFTTNLHTLPPSLRHRRSFQNLNIIIIVTCISIAGIVAGIISLSLGYYWGIITLIVGALIFIPFVVLFIREIYLLRRHDQIFQS